MEMISKKSAQTNKSLSLSSSGFGIEKSKIKIYLKIIKIEDFCPSVDKRAPPADKKFRLKFERNFFR